MDNVKAYFKENRFYAVQQVADIFGVKRNAVYSWIRKINDPLPSHKLGDAGVIRIHGSDINKWLKDKKVDPLNE